jgi:hypothetical protein
VPAEDVEVIMRNDVKPILKTLWIDDEQRQFLFVPKNTIKRRITITTQKPILLNCEPIAWAGQETPSM